MIIKVVNSKTLLLLFIYIFTNKTNFTEIDKKSNQEKYSIIFIHGSYGINFTALLKIIFYNIFNYKKLKILFNEISEIRFNKKLSNHTSICSNKRGLDEILEDDHSHYAFKYVFKDLNNQFQELLNTKDIKYYAYNWHGCLSNELRKLESDILYNELEKLKKIDSKRKIMIIAFSHGGNIVLDLQKIAIEKKNNFVIDQLILLATPIGKVSEINATNSTFFPKIINIYSLKDYYQVSDILFNFPKTKRFFNKAKNITNIDFRFLKKNKKKLKLIFPNHKYFATINFNKELPIFLTILPSILNIIYNNKSYNNYIITVNINEYINKKKKNKFEIRIKKKL